MSDQRVMNLVETHRGGRGGFGAVPVQYEYHRMRKNKCKNKPNLLSVSALLLSNSVGCESAFTVSSNYILLMIYEIKNKQKRFVVLHLTVVGGMAWS